MRACASSPGRGTASATRKSWSAKSECAAGADNSAPSAIGRELEYYDMPQVRAVVRAAKAQDYRFSALVAGIVQSNAFRLQAVRRE